MNTYTDDQVVDQICKHINGLNYSKIEEISRNYPLARIYQVYLIKHHYEEKKYGDLWNQHYTNLSSEIYYVSETLFKELFPYIFSIRNWRDQFYTYSPQNTNLFLVKKEMREKVINLFIHLYIQSKLNV